MDKLEKILREYLNNGSDRIDVTMVLALIQQCKKDRAEQLSIYGVSNRLETTCAKTEPLIIEMNKEHLVELYNFAYEQAVKTGKVDELKEIDAKLNGC